MYDTTFKCTYNLLNDENDENGLRDDLYRSQLLQAFNMNELDFESKFDTILSYVNDCLLKANKGIIILNKMKDKNHFPFEGMELVILFSYDYFYLTHNCLIDLLNDGDIKDENYNMLIQKIENS